MTRFIVIAAALGVMAELALLGRADDWSPLGLVLAGCVVGVVVGYIEGRASR